MQKINFIAIVSLVLATALFSACGGKGEAEVTENTTPTENVVEVTARGMTFEAPDTIASGWTTFRFINESPMVHFFLIEKLPPGKTLEDLENQMLPIFQEITTVIDEGGDPTPLFSEIPKWFYQIVFRGGPGLTAPNHTAITTLKMEPGDYLIECYLQTNGIIHSYLGMIKKLTVTETASNASPPKADIKMTISAKEGITFDDDITAGTQTIAVYFKDQKPHENLVGHDVHLARLSPDTDLDKLAIWMNYVNAEGYETPAPVEFLGGTQEMAAGETAYFTVDLKPGRYAFVSEVPNANEKGMLKTFTVSSK